MYYSSGNYEAFARPKKPEGVDHKSAYIIGTGLAALSAACYLVRDGQMKGKNIQFVYFSPSSSPLATWQEMIKEIDGDHYYLTDEQYRYILDKYESDGIPTYAIYDAQGLMTFKSTVFPGVGKMQTEIEKALNNK